MSITGSALTWPHPAGVLDIYRKGGRLRFDAPSTAAVIVTPSSMVRMIVSAPPRGNDVGSDTGLNGHLAPRPAAGTQLVDHPSVTFPRPLFGRIAHTRRVVSPTHDQGLVDQRLLVAPVGIDTPPER